MTVLALTAFTTSSAFAQNLIVNPGFEDNPPPNFENNIGHPITPWVLTGASQSNVVKVDGGVSTSYLNGSGAPYGPVFDAENGTGVGDVQHYLDIANGSNDFYQVFVAPTCDQIDPAAPIVYNLAGSFSTRDNFAGSGAISLRYGAGTGGATVPGSLRSVNLPANTTADGWTEVTATTTLPQGATLTYLVDMDDNINFDKAVLEQLTSCPRLGILKDVDQATNVPVGTTLTYTYTVTNAGDERINEVFVTDVHEGSGTLSTITLTSINNISGTSTDDGADNDVDALAPGDSAVFTATYTVTQADIDANVNLDNTATAHGTPSGANGFVTLPTAVQSVDLVDALPPLAGNDSLGGLTTGTNANLNVLINDADQDGGTLDTASVRLTTTGLPAGSAVSGNGKTLDVPGQGVWIEDGTGQVTFFPNPGFTADPTPVRYTVADNAGFVSNAATITLDYVAEPPVAQDDAASGLPTNTPAIINPLANNGNGADADPDGTLDATRVVLTGTGAPAGSSLAPNGKTLTVPGEGVWTVNATTGIVTFTPAAGFTADPTPVTYTVADNDGNVSNEATITLGFLTQSPTAQDDLVANLPTNTPATVNPLVNNGNGADSDPDGTLDATSVVLTGTGASPDGKTLTVPGEGTWTVNATTGIVTFTPDTGFTADPTPVTYTVDDNDGNSSNEATITLDFATQAPTAQDDLATGLPTNTPATINPLVNNGNGADSDPDGSLDATSVVLTGTGVSPDGKMLTVPGEGTWTVNASTGAVTFTPNTGFTADPTPVTYTVADNDGNVSNEATITLDFAMQAPTAQDDLATGLPTNTPATINPLANNGNGADSDPDGTLDATSVVLTSTGVSPDGKTLTVPGEGVWTVNAATGVVTFTPAGGFTADPTPVTYTVADNDGNVSNEATITLDYIAQDPTARDDQLTGLTSGSPAMINPLADNGNGADSDPDGSLDATSVVLTGAGASPDGKTLTVPGEGVWTVNPTTGAVTFSPETGFTADPTPVTYTVDDNDGNSSNEATITLDYPQTAPVAVDDNAVGVPGQVARVNVLGNDTDAESDIDPTTVALTDPAATDTNADGIPDRLVVAGEGVWTVDPVTGEVSFTPDPAFAGDPTPIRYQVSDTTGLVSNTALITIDYPVTGTGISGIAYTDRDASGTYDSGTDVLMPGVIVELRNPGGVLIAQGVTDANGAYSLSDFAVGDDFTLSFIEAGTGDVLDTITDLAFAPNTVMTNQDGLVVPAVPVGALSLAKTALVRDVQIGGTAPFDITLTNSTAVQVGPVTVIDNLPAGLIYQPDSAMLDGVPVTPVVEGRQVRLEGVMVPPNGTATLRLITRVTSASAMGEIVNRASVIDPDTGLQATGDATASIYLRPEAVFHCTDVIGKVFDDRNMDGYQNAPAPEISLSTRGMVQNYDAPLGGKADGAAQVAELTGEPGLANVRLVTPTGTIITTDAHGRFSVPCAELPAAIGTNFALKLDTRSLPTGYRVTTENPLVMRLTAGIMAEMNFGAALGRVATVDLTASAFTPGAANPSPRLEQGLQGLLTQIAETPTVLRLSYFTGGDDTALAAARLDAVEQIINEAWADIGSYRLQIERTTKQLQ